MGLGRNDLAGIAEEFEAENRISTHLYCAECGYCLWKLPYVYSCPECGSLYNARALNMEGIFFPGDFRFPFSEMVALLVAMAAALVLAESSLERVKPPAAVGMTSSPPAPVLSQSPDSETQVPIRSDESGEDGAVDLPPGPSTDRPIADSSVVPPTATVPVASSRRLVVIDSPRLVIAAFFGLMGLAYLWRVSQQTRRFIKGLSITRRIEADEE